MSSSNGRGKAKVLAPLAPRRAIVNADEAVPTVYEVPFTEWVAGEPYQVGDHTITPRKPVQRIAFIYNFVSAIVYDAFMARLDEIQSMMPALQATQTMNTSTPEGLAEVVAAISKEQLTALRNLQYECVLVVWQNSEEDMDLERLKRGLRQNWLDRLFNDFFSQFSQQQGKAEGDGSISPA